VIGVKSKYATEVYGVEVVGVTVSEQQAFYARELCKDLSVSILLKDYRDIKRKI
jgi:cyclopropane-fatty-acyl-phospholipid synthase